MQKKPLPIGIENFDKMITNNYFYIDKTLFIKDLLDKKAEVNLFTRPRRFGKSLTLNMLQCFFENSEHADPTLFDGMSIMDAGPKYISEMHKYPVIRVTLKNADRTTYKASLYMLKTEIIREFNRHRYLLNSDRIEDDRKKLFNEILRYDDDEDKYSNGIGFLSECLMLHHGQKTIILIDEYDVPLERSHFNGYYGQMINFMRGFFNTALKSNYTLHFAVLTGCLRVSKESIFTGFNNPKIISITSSEYGEFFGFTDLEVQNALEYYGFRDRIEEARQWYNGYYFGEVNVYNPWSIIYYLNDLYNRNTKFPKPYWSNTSSNSIVRDLISVADSETQDEVETLIRGGSVTKPIHEDVVYGEIKNDMNNLWNFLFFTGYLKKVAVMTIDDQIYFELVVPNKEVLYVYNRKIREWFNENTRLADTSVLLKAIQNKDTETITNELNYRLASLISFYDSQEAFYHGFLLGILSNLRNYTVKSNRETGNGRCDIFMKTRGSNYGAAVIEVKHTKMRGKMESLCDEALKQIEEKNYVAELEEDGYKDVLQYGISFYGKECMVKAR